MKRIIAALSVAVVAGPAFSLGAEDKMVVTPQECPPGTSALAHYGRHDGRFVRDGWACTMDPQQ